MNPHSKMEKALLACLIIDDARLVPRYGCLDYKELLIQMKSHNFFTEIAFIPYNYRRSDPQTIRLFTDNTDYYSLCVHGCNHIRNEFGKGSYQDLINLAAGALWCMEQHKKITNLSYDPVMVFPQGLFCSTAIKALKDAGFFAAFNSTIRAIDATDLPSTEYKLPATLAYYDFPLFLRRYPSDITGIMDDISNGRPIIIVEHHSAFRNGYKSITDLIDWLNITADIHWTSLLNIAEHYSGKKFKDVDDIGTIIKPPPELDVKTKMRRFLCEVRDNYIETSSLMAKIYKILRG